ncbi:MAG: hypothetical protein KDC34_19035 [Saprospiraceae bacterium]|nr:hypothetical protein [Saprospiraceae bacterium]
MKRYLVFWVFIILCGQISGQSGTRYDVEYARICLIDSIAPDTVNQFWRFTPSNTPGSYTRDITWDLSLSYVVSGTVKPCCSCLSKASASIVEDPPFRYAQIKDNWALIVFLAFTIIFMIIGNRKQRVLQAGIALFFLFLCEVVTAQPASGTKFDIEYEMICLQDSIAPDNIVQFWRFTQANSPGTYTRDVTFDFSLSYTVVGTVIPCEIGGGSSVASRQTGDVLNIAYFGNSLVGNFQATGTNPTIVYDNRIFSFNHWQNDFETACLDTAFCNGGPTNLPVEILGPGNSNRDTAHNHIAFQFARNHLQKHPTDSVYLVGAVKGGVPFDSLLYEGYLDSLIMIMDSSGIDHFDAIITSGGIATGPTFYDQYIYFYNTLMDRPYFDSRSLFLVLTETSGQNNNKTVDALGRSGYPNIRAVRGLENIDLVDGVHWSTTGVDTVAQAVYNEFSGGPKTVFQDTSYNMTIGKVGLYNCPGCVGSMVWRNSPLADLDSIKWSWVFGYDVAENLQYLENSFILGNSAAMLYTTAQNILAIGNHALGSALTRDYVHAIGEGAGFNNTKPNVWMIGDGAGYNNTRQVAFMIGDSSQADLNQQFAVGSTQYLSGKWGPYQTWDWTQTLGASEDGYRPEYDFSSNRVIWTAPASGGDNLGNSIATTTLQMASNPIEGVTYLLFTDLNGDTDSLAIIENNITGAFEFRKSSSASPLLSLLPSGIVRFGGSNWPSLPGASGTIPKSDGVGGVTWQPDNTGTGGTLDLYTFSATDTTTTALTNGVWNPIGWDSVLISDPSYTLIGTDTIRFDSAGTYFIEITFVAGSSPRLDCWTRITRDTGAGFSKIKRGKMPVTYMTGTPTFPEVSSTIIHTIEVSANHLIQAELYPGGTGFTYRDSEIRIIRKE